MADIDSALPVGGIYEVTPTTFVDGDNGVPIQVDENGRPINKLSDGTNELDLVVVDSAYGATPTAIPVAGKYELTPTTYADGDATAFLTDENGKLQVDIVASGNASVIVDDSAFTPATSSVTAVGYYADETTPDSVDEGDIGAARMTLDRKQLIVIADATTDSQRLAINATGEVGVVQATHDDLNANATLQINDVDVSATVPVPVSATEAANTVANPIFVELTQGVSATEVHDYNTAAAVAKDATSNHDYTVTGTTFLLKQAIGSASGAQKIEIQSGPVAGLTTKAVRFSSSANPDWDVAFAVPIEVPVTSTGTVRIIRTNRDNQAMDVYSTIIGNDI